MVAFRANCVYYKPVEQMLLLRKCLCNVLYECVGCGSLLFGNLIVYFLFADETYITSDSRTVLFIILTAACVIGVLLMIFFRQIPTDFV